MESLDLKKTITGLCYVRTIKDKKNYIGGYLLINNNNKPIKEVYEYEKYRKFKCGDSLNSIKRKVYDLSHFYDFMNINLLTPELIDYKDFYNFIAEYLLKIDPDFRVNDCIERSMLKNVPLLAPYRSDKISYININKIGGIDSESIVRIADNVKLYLEYLNNERHKNIELQNIFNVVRSIGNRDSMLSHLKKDVKYIYSVKGILKAAKIPIRNRNRIKSIDVTRIFEKNEEELFFNELFRKSNPSYQFLFYLLSVTGLRIAEALALKIYKSDLIKYSMDLQNIESDITLIDNDQDIWEIEVKIDPENPPDLQIKSEYPRTIQIIDSTKQFRNLYIQLLLYRNLLFKKKQIKHNYLFVNRSAERLKYPIVNQKFNQIMIAIGLKERLGRDKLVIHSFRHTYASKWIQNLKIYQIDVELDILSKMLGHSNSETTKRTYIHFFKEDILAILKKMDSSQYQTKEQ